MSPTAERPNKSCALTSCKVVVRLPGFTGAKACTLGCGGGEEGGPPRAEHHHLFQLGIVIQGGVREAQGLWDLQGWQDHLGLGCSHPLLVLKLRWWLAVRWQSSASQVEEITSLSSEGAEHFFPHAVEDQFSSGPVVFLFLSGEKNKKNPLVFLEKCRFLLKTHSNQN